MRDRARLLLICSWVHRSAEIHRALEQVGIYASLVRVDVEPALRAALVRGGYAAVVFVSDTPGLQRDLVETHILLHALDTPLVVVECISAIGSALVQRLRAR